MKAERLLQLYDRVSDAPDAIPRLRRFILDLAVRGKLVEQDPNDEPASELERRLASELSALVARSAIRKPKQFPPLDREDLPFELPSAWTWTQLARVGLVNPRNDANDECSAGFVPMQEIAADYGVAHGHEPRAWGEIKKGYTHFAEGDVGLAKITPCFENGKSTVFRGLPGGVGSGTTELHILRPVWVNPDYILVFLKSPHFIGNGIPRMTGTAGQKRVPLAYFAASPFPLPPLAEQARIVAKVDELIALCDSLEAERDKREATRDRLTMASLSRLTAPDVDEKQFKAHADFAINVLPELTTRPDQIKVLRQTILDLAVRGKLVEQDPNEEPASLALARIVQTKKGIADASVRKRKLVAPAELTEIIHALPAGWSSARISDLVRVINGRAYKQSELLESGTPVLRVGNLFTSKHWYYSDLELQGDKYCDNGDLIYAWSASFGPFLWEGPRAIFHYHIWKLSLFSEIDLCKRFLYYFLLHKTELIKGSGHGISMVHMTKERMEQIMVPFPPLSEQRRIVARVDELMTVCDQLEQSLVWGADTRCCLLKALLADAFEPATIEAAYSSLTVQ